MFGDWSCPPVGRGKDRLEEERRVQMEGCSRDDRPPVELYVEPAVLGDDAQGCQCPFVLCLHIYDSMVRLVPAVVSNSVTPWTAARQAPLSMGAQLVKNPPTMQETLVRFLGREDPVE